MNDIRICYDIIGDIHGRFDKLESLLGCLGYRRDGAGFSAPPSRKAVFLGDLIDTKPGHPVAGGVRATLQAVKSLCDRGDARCVMGNHEWNAICFHSMGPEGSWLREHSDKNVSMHRGTLDDFPDHSDPGSEWRQTWMPWLMRLPLYLDLGGIRAVHACWHPEMIARIRDLDLGDPDLFLACSRSHTSQREAVEILLKGIEVPLPPNRSFVDHGGNPRSHFRARWWEAATQQSCCRDLVFPFDDQIQDWPLPDGAKSILQPYPEGACPVFFGHYLKPAGSPLEPERHNVACLDHSAAIDGPFLAYCWQGEGTLGPCHYVTHCGKIEAPR